MRQLSEKATVFEKETFHALHDITVLNGISIILHVDIGQHF